MPVVSTVFRTVQTFKLPRCPSSIERMNKILKRHRKEEIDVLVRFHEAQPRMGLK